MTIRKALITLVVAAVALVVIALIVWVVVYVGFQFVPWWDRFPHGHTSPN